MTTEQYSRVPEYVRRYRRVHPYLLNIILLGQQEAYSELQAEGRDMTTPRDKIAAIREVMKERGDEA
jgi:hypothetical protein